MTPQLSRRALALLLQILKESLKMAGKPDILVFKRLRELKDAF